MPPLRVGVVGCGGIAQMMHLPTLAERADLFQIVALADLSERTVNAVGERYGVRARFKDGRELAGQKDVEAVLLFASRCHRDAVLELLAARKPLLVEKPLAFSLPETEEVARAVREAGVPFMVGYHKRFDPAYLRARRAVQEMRDLRFVEVTVLHPDDGAYRTHHAVLPLPDQPWQPRPEKQQITDTHERVMRGALPSSSRASSTTSTPCAACWAIRKAWCPLTSGAMASPRTRSRASPVTCAPP